MNKKTVTITINPEIHKQGIEQAKKDNRNFSNYLEWLIVNDIEEKKSIDRLK